MRMPVHEHENLNNWRLNRRLEINAATQHKRSRDWSEGTATDFLAWQRFDRFDHGRIHWNNGRCHFSEY
jgi:hypothetical protein